MLNFCDEKFPDRDVVVAGFGAVTGFGLTVDDLWQGLCQNQRAVRPLNSSDIQHWDALAEFLKRVPAAAIVDHEAVLAAVQSRSKSDAAARIVVDTFGFDVVNAMAMLATLDAVEDAGLTLPEIRRMNVGCVVGTSKPSLRSVEGWFQEIRRTSSASSDSGSASLFESAFLPDSCQRACSQLIAATGPGQCPVAACATGLIAVLQGALLIRSGTVDVCVVGSADASATASVIAAFHRLGVLSHHDDPSSACRPFDETRDGFQVGEGAGILVLESAAHARARGFVPSTTLTHGAWRTDPTGLTQIDISGSVVSELFSQMDDGTSTDLCSLHGTGTVPNDLCESKGVCTFFQDRVPECFGIKGATGHLLGAAGAVELGIALRSMRQQVVLPTVNFSKPDAKCPIPVRTSMSQNQPMKSLTKLSLGFGGHVVGCRAKWNS